MQLIQKIGLVALGSALGGLLRWVVGLSFAGWFGTRFPWGTFFINVSGCLFLGWFYRIVSDRVDFGMSVDHLKLLVAIGFTGGYTTFSSFEYEANQLLSDGSPTQWTLCTLYLTGSVVLGLIAVQLGDHLARRG